MCRILGKEAGGSAREYAFSQKRAEWLIKSIKKRAKRKYWLLICGIKIIFLNSRLL